MNIIISNVTKRIKGISILNNINMHLSSGKIYGLQGHNGSGKTMLLRLIAGLIHATEGEVIINDQILGKTLDFYSPMGVLIETPAFLPNYSGLKNLELLSQLQGIISKQDVVQAMIDVGLDPYDTKKVRKYSLGMKQRLGLAAVFMEKPDLIILDEPTNALDVQGVEEICKLIQREKDRGALIIVASHDQSIIEILADEVYNITAGNLEKR